MNSNYHINGIQQVGIGCADAQAMFDWYRKHLGFDIRVFDDASSAALMTQYTGGTVYNRRAILAMNMNGGGGLEIWQFTDRAPHPPSQAPRLGDLGINRLKLRSMAVDETASYLSKQQIDGLTSVSTDALGRKHCTLVDPGGNAVEIIEGDYVFSPQKRPIGAVMGVSIGVSDIDASIPFYKELLGYDIIQADSTLIDSASESNQERYRSVILQRSDKRSGGFGKLLGPTEIELVQCLDRSPVRTYAGRYWGDIGYIHLCFDVAGMQALSERASVIGYPLTVDSDTGFDMGEAAGRFGYIEDPDGTLIELVETHKVPIMKSLGIYINMRKRDPLKPLPNYIVKAMAIHRVKD